MEKLYLISKTKIWFNVPYSVWASCLKRSYCWGQQRERERGCQETKTNTRHLVIQILFIVWPFSKNNKYSRNLGTLTLLIWKKSRGEGTLNICGPSLIQILILFALYKMLIYAEKHLSSPREAECSCNTYYLQSVNKEMISPRSYQSSPV